MHHQLGRFLEVYRGSSFPTRAETASGEVVVVKLRGAGNGAAALISEFVVNRLTVRAGLPTPDANVLLIEPEHPWDFGTDEYYDLVRKSSGANLALALIEGAKPLQPAECDSLSDQLVSQVVTIDRAFFNVDRTARNPNLLRDAQGKVWIVDHGSCRFLFKPGDHVAVAATAALAGDHLFADWSDAFDPRWLAPITGALIAETVAEIPAAWLAEARLTRDYIATRTAACVNAGQSSAHRSATSD